MYSEKDILLMGIAELNFYCPDNCLKYHTIKGLIGRRILYQFIRPTGMNNDETKYRYL